MLILASLQLGHGVLYLSVCMCVGLRAYLKNEKSTLHIFDECRLWLGPPLGTLSTLHYVLPVRWMTSCLPIVGHAVTRRVRCLLIVTRQVAAPVRGRSLLSTLTACCAACSVLATCWHSVLFCSFAVLDPRVGHTMHVLSPFIPVHCHSD